MIPQIYLAGIVVAVSAAVGFGAGWKSRAVIADSTEAKMQAGWQEERINAQAAALRAQAEVRAEEARRTKLAQEAAREADIRAQSARRDAVAAADASRKLREHIARLVAPRSGPADDPAVAGTSEAAAGPGLVFAVVFERIDTRAGELAALADNARIAGLACEAAYEGLRAPP